MSRDKVDSSKTYTNAPGAGLGGVRSRRFSGRRTRKPTSARRKIVAGVALVILLAGAYAFLAHTGALAPISNRAALQELIVRLGPFGPMIVIGTMALAIVISPIPSAPIALASGAAFGHTWGTIYVVIGAEIGALIAFMIARLVGHEVLQKRVGERLGQALRGSQNTLMAIVFATRLLPFISFDLVSYAAGLTPLFTWRFAVATLAGITPASFLLAHFGDEMASTDAGRIAFAVLALGGLTLIPVAVKLVRAWRQRRAANSPNASRH